MAYDLNNNNRNILEEIQKAVDAKDYKLAAQLEQERNEKIDYLNSTGTNQWEAEKTSKYAGWLDETDYGTVGKTQMESGASAEEVLDTYIKRYNKAANTEGLQQYANDEIQQEMLDYVQANMNKPQTQVNDYSNYLEDAYDAKKRQALAELNAAYESNLNAIDRAGEGVDGLYQRARNSAAGASELAKRNFAEYAAASGLNSGAGGQVELARIVALQNSLNEISVAEADTIADLQLQRANAEVEYNNAIAQAQAQHDYELASVLYQEKVRVQEALIELEIQERQYALQQYEQQYQADRDQVSDQKYSDSVVQTQRETLAQYGYVWLSMGAMPSDEMLEAMGITREDAEKYLAALRA